MRSNSVSRMALVFVAVLAAGCADDDPASTTARVLVAMQRLESGFAGCAAGGISVSAGSDLNGDGLLDAEETDSTQHLCNGTNGSQGASAPSQLVSSTTLSVGHSACSTGGVGLAFGIDLNSNGQLDPEEISLHRNVCNGVAGTQGATGARALILLSAEGSGQNCVSGGTKIEVGADWDNDGVLQAAEVAQTSYACAGAAGTPGTPGPGALVTSLPLAVGDAHCATGGVEVLSGVNTDGSGSLTDAHGLPNTNVTRVAYVCHGSAGAAGRDALIENYSITVGGSTCPYGGVEILTGRDNDGSGRLKVSGVLNAANVLSSSSVCNGSPAGLAWTNVTTATRLTAQPNMGYLVANDSAGVEITLPSNPAIGDVIRVKGASRMGWTLRQSAGQYIDLAGWDGMSRLAGDTWTNWTAAGGPNSSLHGSAWGSVAVSPDGDRLYAAVWGGGIYGSTNGGVTWVKGNAPDLTWYDLRVSANATTLIAADAQTATGGVSVSRDGGLTWARVFSASQPWPGMAVVSVDSTGQRMLVAASGDAIHQSTDGGQTWNPALAANDWAGLAGSLDQKHLYAFAHQVGIYASHDYGVTWQLTGAPAISSHQLGNSLTTSGDGMFVYATSTTNIYRSVDGGASWSMTAAPVHDWVSVNASTDGMTVIAVADNNSAHISRDGGASWAAVGPTGLSYPVGAMDLYGNTFASSSFYGDIYSTRSQRNWSTQTEVGTAGYIQGGAYDAIELVYLGSGRFGILSALSTQMVAH